MLALRRLAAYVIDFLLLAAVLVGLQLLLSLWIGDWMATRLQKGPVLELWVLLGFSLPVWMYFVLCETRWRQTLGKRWLGIQVSTAYGQPPRLWQVALRTLVKLLPWELTHLVVLLPEPWWGAADASRPLIYLPNALILLYLVWLFSTGGKRAVHDLLPGTRVERTQKPPCLR